MNENAKKILQAIKDLTVQNGYTPTIREIGKKVSLSPSTVHGHLKKMQEAGYIKKQPIHRTGIYNITE